MTIRRPLQKRLVDAWSHLIETDYAKQRINSERSLQAALWASLNNRLPDHQRMFIEPRLRQENSSRFFVPDLVICGKRRIIAVIEIKYRPRNRALYRKDLRTLNLLSRDRDDYSVRNKRHAGPIADKTTYTFSTNTLFIWAGFHRPLKDDSYASRPPLSKGYESIEGCFMQLHAETSEDGLPTIIHRVG